jgi:hypothetical protein
MCATLLGLMMIGLKIVQLLFFVDKSLNGRGAPVDAGPLSMMPSPRWVNGLGMLERREEYVFLVILSTLLE